MDYGIWRAQFGTSQPIGGALTSGSSESDSEVAPADSQLSTSSSDSDDSLSVEQVNRDVAFERIELLRPLGSSARLFNSNAHLISDTHGNGSILLNLLANRPGEGTAAATETRPTSAETCDTVVAREWLHDSIDDLISAQFKAFNSGDFNV
jgi:hypothetical protein